MRHLLTAMLRIQAPSGPCPEYAPRLRSISTNTSWNMSSVAAVEARGARVERLPPYSPDESPIEEMFSKVKEYLRSAAARTVDAVIAAMGSALNQVTPSDIDGWFYHRCVYAKLL